MNQGQLFAPGQVNPGVNFVSVYGMAPVSVHMSFSLPCGNLNWLVTFLRHRVTRPAWAIFSM